MIKTTNMLLEELRSYANPKAKLSRMVKRGECFRIARGLYETDKNILGRLCLPEASMGRPISPLNMRWDSTLSLHPLRQKTS